MEAVRRYVFPVIWMLVLALIAAALVKLAFFSGEELSAQAEGEAPVAAVDALATVPVTRGDIASSLTLSATVEPDDGTALRAADAGEIVKIWVGNGDTVAAGDKILQVRYEDPVEATAVDSADPAAPAAPAEPQVHYKTLTAPSAGKIQDLEALKGQTLNIGDPVATVSPGTYAITAPLTPDQQLQLLDQPITASAALPSSADPIPCEAPSISEQDPSKDAANQPAAAPEVDPGTGEPLDTGGSSKADLRCPVPPGTRIVPGLEVDVVVDLGAATGVLTVPTTAVEGEDTAGKVYLLDDATGEPTAHEVTLGKRGEDTVEITGGLDEGQEVLRFVPGVENPDDTGLGW